MNPQPDSKNVFETTTKREDRKKAEHSHPDPVNPKHPENPGSGIYFVSFSKTTESFNFGTGGETGIRDDDDDLVNVPDKRSG